MVICSGGPRTKYQGSSYDFKDSKLEKLYYVRNFS